MNKFKKWFYSKELVKAQKQMDLHGLEVKEKEKFEKQLEKAGTVNMWYTIVISALLVYAIIRVVFG